MNTHLSRLIRSAALLFAITGGVNGDSINGPLLTLGATEPQGGVDMQYSVSDPLDPDAIAALSLYANSSNPALWQWGYGTPATLQMSLDDDNVLTLYSAGLPAITFDPGAGEIMMGANKVLTRTPDSFVLAGNNTAYGETKMMWIPDKGAFRAGGSIYDWDPEDLVDYSTGFGRETLAGALYSTAMGYYSCAGGEAATAAGGGTFAFGYCSTAMGLASFAMGEASTAIGSGNMADGNRSTAIGDQVVAESYKCVSLGTYNERTVYDCGDWVETDPLLVVGNGTEQAFSNAVTTLKNGQTTLTNKAWKAQGEAFVPNASNSQGQALVVEGNTVLNGNVIMAKPQGDISMGIYGGTN